MRICSHNYHFLMIFLFSVQVIHSHMLWWRLGLLWYFYSTFIQLRHLACAMMNYFFLPTIQSCFVHFTAIVLSEKKCCPSFIFCAVVIYYAPMLQQTLLVVSCDVSYAYCYFLPAMHVPDDRKKGEAFSAYHKHNGDLVLVTGPCSNLRLKSLPPMVQPVQCYHSKLHLGFQV